MTQFTLLQLLNETLSRYEQIDVSYSSVNVITDSCVETLIPESDDFFPKESPFPLGRKQQKKVQEKKEHDIKI